MAGSEFKFNFFLDADGAGKANQQGTSAGERDQETPPSKLSVIPFMSEQIPFHKKTVDSITPNIFSIPDSGTKLKYFSGEQAYEIASAGSTNNAGMELESLSESQSQHSDLIPGVYEGGLKVWECAFDLVNFLSESTINLSGMKILELGCGTGLPGIYSLIKGAECVHFQDYNPEVINNITIPNVILNSKSMNGIAIQDRVKFYSGDWGTLASVLEPNSVYDVILTSETIYSLESQPKLLAAMKELSRPKDGLVLVAAKSFYFGVGGSVESFCQLLKEDGTFGVSLCKDIEANVPRVILKLTHNSN